MGKTGGLAALMAGQSVAKKKVSKTEKVQKAVKASGIHIFLVLFCLFYIIIGAVIFQYLESEHEEAARVRTNQAYHALVKQFMKEVGILNEVISDEKTLNSSLTALLDQHTQRLFDLYTDPIARNYFESLVYKSGEYRRLWSLDAAVLLTSTTMVPVGFGLVTPMTIYGKLFLIIYAMFGIPLCLVTMDDLGRFLCDAIFIILRENLTALTVSLLVILFLYPVLGGVWIHLVSTMTLFDSVYYCCITILTVGFGDIDPPIAVPGLVLFIVVGVTWVTISVDVIATQVIHRFHYMGRQMGKAKEAAAKLMQIAQKININKGLGLGMAQLGAFARMGMMIQVNPGNPQEAETTLLERQLSKKSTAYDPDLDFDLIDRGYNYLHSDDVPWID